MGFWFTSDLHIGHEFVAKLRGFPNVDAHDKAIIANINKRVSNADTLFILGDLVMGGWEKNLVKLQDLPGTVHVILGNHDRPHPGNKNGHEHLLRWINMGGFASANTLGRHGNMLMSHFPYDGDTDGRMEARCDEYRLRDMGQTLLHGHTHSNKRFTLSAEGTPQIHVGLDAWGMKPVSLHQIEQLIKEKK